ncbi:MAG: peptide deformylase [Candidatus Taylorbacteria bacterium]|nr:peptide deformylase [Candidatus Taylorbacteria bacterium]
MPTAILQKEQKVLRDTAKEVPISEITSAKIQQIVADMEETMHGEGDAVAIAAPQIGVSLRIFVIAGKARLIFRNDEAKRRGEKQDPLTPETPVPADEVYINPVITKISREKKMMEEGCLSVRYLYGKVHRGVKVTIEAYDEFGNKFTRGGSGLIAQIYQHETDHLNGILFIDKAKDLVELTPEERVKWREKNRQSGAKTQ